MKLNQNDLEIFKSPAFSKDDLLDYAAGLTERIAELERNEVSAKDAAYTQLQLCIGAIKNCEQVTCAAQIISLHHALAAIREARLYPQADQVDLDE